MLATTAPAAPNLRARTPALRLARTSGTPAPIAASQARRTMSARWVTTVHLRARRRSPARQGSTVHQCRPATQALAPRASRASTARYRACTTAPFMRAPPGTTAPAGIPRQRSRAARVHTAPVDRTWRFSARKAPFRMKRARRPAAPARSATSAKAAPSSRCHAREATTARKAPPLQPWANAPQELSATRPDDPTHPSVLRAHQAATAPALRTRSPFQNALPATSAWKVRPWRPRTSAWTWATSASSTTRVAARSWDLRHTGGARRGTTAKPARVRRCRVRTAPKARHTGCRRAATARRAARASTATAQASWCLHPLAGQATTAPAATFCRLISAPWGTTAAQARKRLCPAMQVPTRTRSARRHARRVLPALSARRARLRPSHALQDTSVPRVRHSPRSTPAPSAPTATPRCCGPRRSALRAAEGTIATPLDSPSRPVSAPRATSAVAILLTPSRPRPRRSDTLGRPVWTRWLGTWRWRPSTA